jgi:hypothetical protein
MGWIIAYLCSVIVVAIVAGLIEISDSGHIQISPKDFKIIVLGLLGWPLVASAVPVFLVYDFFRNRLREKANSIVNRNNITSDIHDRSAIILVAEADLKVLMKAVRAKLIELQPHQVEIIRDELQHRVVERSLLK